MDGPAILRYIHPAITVLTASLRAPLSVEWRRDRRSREGTREAWREGGSRRVHRSATDHASDGAAPLSILIRDPVMQQDEDVYPVVAFAEGALTHDGEA